MDITGRIPYYMRLEYRHKENEPCIRIVRQSKSLELADIRYDSWSMTELRQSPFFIKPIINLQLIKYQNTCELIVNITIYST
jgi:hypothetical protein